MGALATGLVLAWRSYQDAEAQRAALAVALERAEEERTRAEAVTSFMTALLEQALPDQSVERELTVVEAPERAVASGALADDPKVEIAVRGSVAWALHGVSRADDARPVLDAL